MPFKLNRLDLVELLAMVRAALSAKEIIPFYWRLQCFPLGSVHHVQGLVHEVRSIAPGAVGAMIRPTATRSTCLGIFAEREGQHRHQMCAARLPIFS